jgi:hypothetical protein
MGKDDVVPSKNLEGQKLTKKLPVGQKKLTDALQQRKIAKETLKENLKIEDEAIIAFLTNSGRRRGFIGKIKGSEKLLSQLENLLNSNDEKLPPGRPKSNKNVDNEKIAFYSSPVIVKHLDGYTLKHGHNSKQDAIRYMIRESLRADGYTV